MSLRLRESGLCVILNVRSEARSFEKESVRAIERPFIYRRRMGNKLPIRQLNGTILAIK